MNEPTPAAGERADVARPLEITTFYAPEAAGGASPPNAPRRRVWRGNSPNDRAVAIALFAATCLCVFMAGLQPGATFLGAAEFLYRAHLVGRLPEIWPTMLKDGAIYFVAVMTILVAHEMGHYLQARRYHVSARGPFFIPFPALSPFGTMGAVILQEPGVADRKSLFDIAISGPLAGLVFAIPITLIGLSQAHVAAINPAEGAQYGDPLLLKWLARIYFGPIPADHDVILNPWLFAGWVGIFITAFNLMPIGQLDGGHILYTLIGRRAHHVAVLLLAVGITFMVVRREFAYALMAALLIITGPRHPPTANDDVPLGPGRIALGWLTLAFLIVGFTPVPIATGPPQGQRQEQPRHQQKPSGQTIDVRAEQRSDAQLAQRDFMNRNASRESCSSLVNMRRQILVAAARSGSARPKASTTSQPSYLVSLRVLNVVSQSTCPSPGVPRSFSEMWTCTV
jgi:Zn-dependent protease